MQGAVLTSGSSRSVPTGNPHGTGISQDLVGTGAFGLIAIIGWIALPAPWTLFQPVKEGLRVVEAISAARNSWPWLTSPMRGPATGTDAAPCRVPRAARPARLGTDACRGPTAGRSQARLHAALVGPVLLPASAAGAVARQAHEGHGGFRPAGVWQPPRSERMRDLRRAPCCLHADRPACARFVMAKVTASALISEAAQTTQLQTSSLPQGTVVVSPHGGVFNGDIWMMLAYNGMSGWHRDAHTSLSTA